MTNDGNADRRDEDLVQVLGYLNFSSGKSDPKSLAALNRLYSLSSRGSPQAIQSIHGSSALADIATMVAGSSWRLRDEKEIFRESDQASQVIQLVWLLPLLS